MMINSIWTIDVRSFENTYRSNNYDYIILNPVSGENEYLVNNHSQS